MNVSEIIKQFGGTITEPDVIICLVGILLLACWLLKTSLGRKALVDSVPRRNNMPLYLPFIPLFIWFGAVSLAVSTARKLLPDLPAWQSNFLDNIILCIGAIATMAVIVLLVRGHFARRLKGFGLNPKTIPGDFGAALVNLLSIWPIVLAAIILTTYLGKLIFGPEFQLQQHEELKIITTHPQLPLRILIVVVAVIIAPLIEEMLFRGLFQTMLRSFLDARNHQLPITNYQISNRAWLSIAISSGIFAMVHSNTGHWPALFALSVCMGYAYEKSGSLFRPIFIHSLFNAASIITALNQ